MIWQLRKKTESGRSGIMRSLEDAGIAELEESWSTPRRVLASVKEKKQGNWYIEEMPDFWIRFQTNNLEYGKNAQLESDGINFMDYAPESKSVLKISRESLNGTENQFSWGQAVRAEYIEDIEKNENVWSRQKGYTRIKGGRAFVLYLKITGPYASEGVLQKKIRKIYRKFQQDAKIPGDAYCVRIKITHDEEGNDWNYLKIYILLKPES